MYTPREQFENRIERLTWDIESTQKELQWLYRYFSQRVEEMRQVVEEGNWSNVPFLKDGLGGKSAELAVVLTRLEMLETQKGMLERLQEKVFPQNPEGNPSREGVEK